MDLVAMVRHVVADHQHHAKENQLSLSCDLPSSPICFHGDAARLSQVLKNLLNNATKFTDAGGSLHVTATVDHDRIKIEVRDTGIGMDAATIDTMFQAFRQADSSIDRSRGGLGLGMALSKRLIKLHRGELSAHSDGLGRGSCFRIELPFDPQATIAAVDQPDSTAAPLRSHRVLIVDDQRSLRLPMRHLLKSLGQECMEAEDGSTALRVAGEFLPEIIWCDIGLPDMDGYAVARAIRSNPELSQIYLVAVTGYGQDDDRRQAEEAGFNRHITKPISVDALRDVIAEYEAGEVGTCIDK